MKKYRLDLTYTAKFHTYVEVEDEKDLDDAVNEVLQNELLELDELRFDESNLELEGTQPVEEK